MRETRAALLFISPWIIGFAVFGLYPLGASLYYSFCDYDILNEPVVVGTLNYQEMVGDSVFWISVYNTVYFALFSIPLGLFTALMIAVLLNQKVVGRSVFRTVYFLPSIVPLVGVAPWFTATVWYSGLNYLYKHRKAHLDTEWGKQHLRHHYDHHMGKNQDANWCVTHPFMDWVMGTRVEYDYDAIERRKRERGGRPRKAAESRPGLASANDQVAMESKDEDAA